MIITATLPDDYFYRAYYTQALVQAHFEIPIEGKIICHTLQVGDIIRYEEVNELREKTGKAVDREVIWEKDHSENGWKTVFFPEIILTPKMDIFNREKRHKANGE